MAFPSAVDLAEWPTACYIDAMMAQVLFNPLAYIDRLTRGGFSPEQARASAEALETAFTESVATKSDTDDIKHDIALLKRDVTEVKRDISETEARLKLEFKKDFSDLRLEISQAKNETLRWVFGFNLVLIGAIFTIMKFVR